MTTSLTVESLPALLQRMHAALSSRRQVLDDLNVFPVPDGDTGTNMVATISAAVEELTVDNGQGAQRQQGDALARAIVRGAIHGARGNSGVILSQVLRAVVEAIVAPDPFDAARYTAALMRARDLAYDAVATPVEGTILTVIGVAADAAQRAIAGGADLTATSAAACDAAGAAVARTRDQLDTLRDAGVVDAGARGFELVLAAMHGHLTGDDPPVVLDPPRPGGLRTDGLVGHADVAEPDLREAIHERVVEVQYLLNAPDSAAPTLRQTLSELGESVVVVGGGGLLNIHVHTAQVGAAIEAGTTVGPVTRIKIEPLIPTPEQPPVHAPSVATRRPVGVVAVVDGTGLAALVDTYGAVSVDVVPNVPVSVADLLVGIGRANAEQVLLLPGRSDALDVARDAAVSTSLGYGRGVAVIETAASPPAVLAALAVFDPDADLTHTVASMRSAGGGVRAGQVQSAVRACDTAVGSTRAGQAIGVVDDEVVAVDDDPLVALAGLAQALNVRDAELVTLLVGAGVDADQRRAAARIVDPHGTDRLRASGGRAPGPDVAVIDALQQDAVFWLGVE